MSQKTSLAGSVMVGTFLKGCYLQKNQRLPVLAGVVVLIALECQLHMELILDGIGLRIPDWILLVSGGSSQRTQYVSF